MPVPTEHDAAPEAERDPVTGPAGEGSEWAPDDADWLSDDASGSLGLSAAPVSTTTEFFDGEVDGSPSSSTSPVAPSKGSERARRRSVKKARNAKRRAKEKRAKRLAPRRRILPRTAIGICLLLLTTALAVGGISAALYMNYAYKKDRTEALVGGLDRRIARGAAKIDAEATNAQARIQDELAPLSKLAATGETLSNLVTTAAPSLWVVRTFDEAGASTVGTAFVVAADAQRSFLLTSYDVIRAATRAPGPAVTLRQGTTDMVATLWTWDETSDLALLIVDRPSLPKLTWGRPTDVRLGTQIFALSALGTAGGAVTQGFVADVSSSGLQHSAPLGSAFRGAPLVDDRGRVIAVASKSFAPLGFVSDGVWFAPPIAAACQKVLRCEADVVKGAGAQR